jgi:hypothetical protein
MEGNGFIGMSSGRASTPPGMGGLVGAAGVIDRNGRVIAEGLGKDAALQAPAMSVAGDRGRGKRARFRRGPVNAYGSRYEHG